MNTYVATSLYDILVEKGIDKGIAKEALSEYITREEAKITLATKDDLARTTRWIIELLPNVWTDFGVV